MLTYVENITSAEENNNVFAVITQQPLTIIKTHDNPNHKDDDKDDDKHADDFAQNNNIIQEKSLETIVNLFKIMIQHP